MRETMKATAAQLAVLPKGQESRQTRRRVVNFAASLEGEDVSPIEVWLTDVSERGCRAHVGHEIEPGTSLVIKLPGIEAVRARAVWSRNGEVGCSFEDEIHTIYIDQVLGKASRPPLFPRRRDVFGLKKVT